MRSRIRKTRHSRISLLDRVVDASQKRRILTNINSRRKSQHSLETALELDITHPTPRSKKRFFWHGMFDRLQQPVGIRPVFLLFLTWLLMLVIIWGACQEIISLGAPNQPKQSVIQVEQKALLELLGALVIGGVGLSLVMTPTLKHQTKAEPHPPMAVSLEPTKD
jgi:small-conductance mechanosensitive channel